MAMKRTSHATGITITLLLALALGACGDGGGDDDVLGLGDRGLDRCSLITADEAESWLGPLQEEPAPATGFDDEPDPVTCSYRGERTNILVQVYDGEVFFAEEGSTARGETLEGLGEDAHADDDSVKFLQNDWAASVAYISGQPLSRTELVEIAELMSSRLP